MDPLFGLVAVPDSKAMETARQRNSSQQKYLERNIAMLENQCHSRTSKINTNVEELCKLLRESNSNYDTRVVFPSGMSQNEKQQYRELRRASLPTSISLDEFDNRLMEAKTKREQERTGSEFYSQDKIVSNKLFTYVPESKLGLLPEASCTSPRGRPAVPRDAFQRPSLVEIKNQPLTDKLTLPPLPMRRRQSESLLNNKNGNKVKKDYDNDLWGVGGFLGTKRRNSAYINLPTEGRQVNSSFRSGVSNKRRSTMPNLKDSETCSQQQHGSGEDKVGKETQVMSRLENIIESWQSAPAVRPSFTD